MRCSWIQWDAFLPLTPRTSKHNIKCDNKVLLLILAIPFAGLFLGLVEYKSCAFTFTTMYIIIIVGIYYDICTWRCRCVHCVSIDVKCVAYWSVPTFRIHIASCIRIDWYRYYCLPSFALLLEYLIRTNKMKHPDKYFRFKCNPTKHITVHTHTVYHHRTSYEYR